MATYDSYKDSGVKWLGQIPSHWEVNRLKHCFFTISEKGHPELPQLCATQKYGVIPQTLYDSRVVSVLKGLDTLKVVRKGDFVISLRSFQGGIEYAHFSGIISPAYTVLRPYNSENSPYLIYLLKSSDYIRLLQSMVTGIREGQNIDYNKLKYEYIPMPPREEQEAIVAYLDGVTGEIDRAIEAQRRMIQALNEREQIIISQAVTRGLDPNVPLRDSGNPWLGLIPQHWEIIPMRFLCRMATGDKDTIMRVDNGLYPFYVRSPKVERINTYSFDGEAVLMAGDGVGAGKVFHYANGKFDFHQRVYNFYNFKHVIGKFLFYYLKSNFRYKIEEGGAKSTVDSVRLPWLKAFPVCFPSKEEQDSICKFIEENTCAIRESISNCERMISLLQERKQIIINEVVTGKKKVI